MRKKFSLIVLGENGSSLKEISFSRRQLLFGSFFLMASLLFISMIVYKIVILKEISPDTEKLETAWSQQSHKLDIQRSRIIKFNNDINLLRKNIQKLKRYEKEVKIIAGIEKIDDPSGNLVGIGGSQPIQYNTWLKGGVNPAEQRPESRQQLHPRWKRGRAKN